MPIQGEGRWKLPEHKVKRAKIHQFPAKKKDGHRVLRKNHLAPRFTPRIKVPPQKAMTLEWNDQGIMLPFPRLGETKLGGKTPQLPLSPAKEIYPAV